MKKRRVITYGTFDLLHIGHINILKRAKELGNELIVGVSTDEFNAIKNKSATYSYDDRKAIVESIKYVDLVIPEKNWNQKLQDIKIHNIDVFVMGDDWRGHFDDLPCAVIYLARTPNISTTELKQLLSSS